MKSLCPYIKHLDILLDVIIIMEEPGRLQSMRSLRVDATERLHFHFSLSCIGKGNGNPLQYSCLENPRDRGAWWAAVYGVAQSRTRLKRLSSSSSSSILIDSLPGFALVFGCYHLQILKTSSRYTSPPAKPILPEPALKNKF